MSSHINVINTAIAPELPPEITDFQVLSGIGADAVLVSPDKLKRFVLNLLSPKSEKSDIITSKVLSMLFHQFYLKCHTNNVF
jgi:hypothetical protein